ERHLPESIRLETHPVRAGSKVQMRSAVEDNAWTVARIVGTTAELIRKTGSAAVECIAPLDDLVVVLEFGDPIYPGLKLLDRIDRQSGRPHLVLESENFHGLQTLLYAMEGQVDAIYIDPPYNTGERS